MRLQKILKMGPGELAYRGWQEASKNLERLAVTAGESSFDPPCVMKYLKPGGERDEIKRLFRAGEWEGAAQRFLREYQRIAPSRFFAGTSDKAIEDILNCEYREEQNAIIAGADAAWQGKFPILGYGWLDFKTDRGSPDWHFDPVAGRQAPVCHWSRINPLDPEQVGDSKVIWELNRHQCLLDLGQAWRFTGNERYGLTFVQLVRNWMRHNPPGIGINWSSSLEVSMRLIAWCWSLAFFIRSRVISPALFVDMLSWIRAHALFIEKYLSYYFSPNTHLTGEALGLYYAGILFPEIQEARRWRTLGRRILIEQLERQVYKDGVYFEQSTRYQYYTAEIYLHFLLLAERNGEDLPEVREKLGAMMDFLLAARAPDGTMPAIGDADGGWLLPLVRRSPGDFDGLFSTAAVLLDRGDFAWAARGPAPETLWLLGSQAREHFPPARAPQDKQLQVFEQGGYVVMRNHWGEDAHHLLFDTGPLGCTGSAGHGHADLLGITCSAFGEAYIVDAGTYCYTTDQLWRNHFRASGAHNTISLDEESQARPAAPFAWENKPAARLEYSRRTPGMISASARHEAWRDLADSVSHRRRVFFMNERCWIIVDDLKGAAIHRIDLRYQFDDQALSREAVDWVRARGQGGSALLLRTFCVQPLETRIRTGELDPIEGWISDNYGERRPAPVLVWSATAKLPLRIVTLLYPLADPNARPPTVRPLGEADIEGLVFENPEPGLSGTVNFLQD